MSPESWKNWSLKHVRSKRAGAMVDAVNRGENQFDVTTHNVRRFTIWLHPEMANLSKAVRVTVNGSHTVEQKVITSVSTALDSYVRRKDWGLVYPAKITITVNDPHSKDEKKSESAQ